MSEPSALPCTGEGGNTRTPSPKNSSKKTQKIEKKTDKRSRRFCITLNNWTENDYTLFKNTFESDAKEYIIGREVGKEGTRHLQVYVHFKDGKTFSAVKKILGDRIHIEEAKGNAKKNFEYCSKDGSYDTNMACEPRKNIGMRECLKEYDGVVWKEWQVKIFDILKSKPDKRTIHWFWEPTGNIGKTFLAKYIVMVNKGVIIAEGKKNDIFNQVNAMYEHDIPRIVIIDIPRCSLEYVSFAAIEALKNGMLYSGKYEGGRCIFPSPHVICFANEEPRRKELSADRWVVTEL